MRNEIKHIRRKRLMKLSIFRECGEFTVVGLTRTHLRKGIMKLSALWECAELNSVPCEKTATDINLKLFRQIFDPNQKNKILDLLPKEHGMIKKTNSRYFPFKNQFLHKINQRSWEICIYTYWMSLCSLTGIFWYQELEILKIFNSIPITICC